MSNKTKLKIGEFSQMMQITVKTLRFYEHKGLILPDEVDEWTGYRYYSIGQMQKLKSIRDLQQLGFSLDKIRDLYDNSLHVPDAAQIAEKIKETERQIQLLTRRRNRLLQLRNSRKHITKMEKFYIQPLPEIIVASHREVIPNFEALGPLCYEKIGPEMQRLGCKCPQHGYCFTVEHGSEYTPTNIDIEYCEQVEEMGTDSAIIKFKRLPAVPKALCMKHIGPYERLYESFTELFKYIEEHGYKIVGKHRTCYVDGAWNQDDPEKWVSIIQIPIE